MIVFPNCKINLGLSVIEKRTDGYHEIETVFYPVPLKDALEIIVDTNDTGGHPVQLSSSGIPVEVQPHENICVKAYNLLKKDFPQLPSIKMHLHKLIPSGAGLGGGSSDGAFTLKMLSEKFYLGLSKEQLIFYASQLGSDCSFFILNKPCMATGRGEILEPVELNLGSYKILLVYPGIHINTAMAYSQTIPSGKGDSLKNIISQPIESWKENLFNDFEKSIFKNHPETGKVKEKLYESGALYAALSGSGSSVFGIFKHEATISVSFPSHYYVKELSG